ncbi:hypothetical protein pb186bvf_002230 [Paramecium bursaria]
MQITILINHNSSSTIFLLQLKVSLRADHICLFNNPQFKRVILVISSIWVQIATFLQQNNSFYNPHRIKDN